YVDLDGEGDEWEEYLPEVCTAHNTAVHDRVRLSPFELMFGVPARMPFETLLPSERDPPTSGTAEQQRVYERMRALHAVATRKVMKGKKRQKRNYDRRREEIIFNSGDLVAIRRPRMARQLPIPLRRAWQGPFEIKRRIRPELYMVGRRGDPDEWAMHITALK